MVRDIGVTVAGVNVALGEKSIIAGDVNNDVQMLFVDIGLDVSICGERIVGWDE